MRVLLRVNMTEFHKLKQSPNLFKTNGEWRYSNSTFECFCKNRKLSITHLVHVSGYRRNTSLWASIINWYARITNSWARNTISWERNTVAHELVLCAHEWKKFPTTVRILPFLYIISIYHVLEANTFHVMRTEKYVNKVFACM